MITPYEGECSVKRESTFTETDRDKMSIDYEFLNGCMQKQFKIFKLKPAETRIICDSLKSAIVEVGTVIIKQGKPGNSFFILEEGTLAVMMFGMEVQ